MLRASPKNLTPFGLALYGHLFAWSGSPFSLSTLWSRPVWGFALIVEPDLTHIWPQPNLHAIPIEWRRFLRLPSGKLVRLPPIRRRRYARHFR